MEAPETVETVGEPGLTAWMRVGQPIEDVLAQYERCLDAWESGGVRGLVVGRLYFRSEDNGSMVPAFSPNRALYQDLGVEPPPPVEVAPGKRALLDEFLEATRNRGWPVLVFEPAAGSGAAMDSLLVSDEARRIHVARLLDAAQQFPMVSGVILDGPEWGYEIDPGHRSYIFGEHLGGEAADKARALGYDPEELNAALESLDKSLGDLTPQRVGVYRESGVLNAMKMLRVEPALIDWLRFRASAITDYFREVRRSMDSFTPGMKLGLGTRSPCFTALTGSDHRALAEVVDLMLPKHYFWQHGFDGLYGTIYRYVCTIADRSGISDGEALAVVETLFGLRLPGVRSRLDLELGPSRQFYEETVRMESQRSLAAMDDPARVIPWVDTGRLPHQGEPLTARDLRQILTASAGAGIRTFLYHNHAHLTASEWAIISALCGKPWNPGDHGYQPPDGSHQTPPREGDAGSQ